MSWCILGFLRKVVTSAWVSGATLVAVFTAGCVDSGWRTVDNGYFRVEFADPNDSELGCRFLKAGWITGLYPTNCDESLVLTESLVDFHPTLGYTFEITPPLDLEGTQALQVGVGVINKHPRNRFRSWTAEQFPWKIQCENSERETAIIAYQSSGMHSGYSYELRLRISVSMDSPKISWKYTLTNTGVRPLVASTYVHPFFKTDPDFVTAWYALPGRERCQLASMPANTTLVQGDLPPDYSTIEVGGLGKSGHVVRMESNCSFNRIDIWRPVAGCFAVEAYLPIEIAPDEQLEWSWNLQLLP